MSMHAAVRPSVPAMASHTVGSRSKSASTGTQEKPNSLERNNGIDTSPDISSAIQKLENAYVSQTSLLQRLLVRVDELGKAIGVPHYTEDSGSIIQRLAGIEVAMTGMLGRSASAPFTSLSGRAENFHSNPDGPTCSSMCVDDEASSLSVNIPPTAYRRTEIEQSENNSTPGNELQAFSDALPFGMPFLLRVDQCPTTEGEHSDTRVASPNTADELVVRDLLEIPFNSTVDGQIRPVGSTPIIAPPRPKSVFATVPRPPSQHRNPDSISTAVPSSYNEHAIQVSAIAKDGAHQPRRTPSRPADFVLSSNRASGSGHTARRHSVDMPPQEKRLELASPGPQVKHAPKGQKRSSESSTPAHPTKKRARSSSHYTSLDGIAWPAKTRQCRKFQRAFIRCDNCKCWLHYGCGGITSEKEAAVSYYICPPCKSASTDDYLWRMRTEHDYSKCIRPDCFHQDADADSQDAEDYIVEKIVGRKPRSPSKYTNKAMRYYWLVKWEGYSVRASEWKMEEEMGSCAALVQRFNQDAASEGHGNDLERMDAEIMLAEAIEGGCRFDPR
ncbi:hypothetical protein PLICRDRAFT_92522 [Plicaturopsis crispa FD-325 SS-3]|nr:hypothetical protein PLICRDRAFT_92522 [Plicaturopsis crispa FD-325 SS-3]